MGKIEQRAAGTGGESACEVKPAFLGPGRVFLPEESLCYNSEDEEDTMCKDTVQHPPSYSVS